MTSAPCFRRRPARRCSARRVRRGAGCSTNPHVWPPDDYVEYWAAGRLNLTGGNPYSADELLPLEQARRPRHRRSDHDVEPAVDAHGGDAARGTPAAGRAGGVADAEPRRGRRVGVALVDTLTAGRRTRRWVGLAVAFTFVPTLFVLQTGPDLRAAAARLCPVRVVCEAGLPLRRRCRRRARSPSSRTSRTCSGWPSGWTRVVNRRWRIVLGGVVTGVIATAIPMALNPDVWAEYFEAYRNSPVPPSKWVSLTLGVVLRLAYGADQFWLQFVPMGLVLVGVRLALAAKHRRAVGLGRATAVAGGLLVRDGPLRGVALRPGAAAAADPAPGGGLMHPAADTRPARRELGRSRSPSSSPPNVAMFAMSRVPPLVVLVLLGRPAGAGGCTPSPPAAPRPRRGARMSSTITPPPRGVATEGPAPAVRSRLRRSRLLKLVWPGPALFVLFWLALLVRRQPVPPRPRHVLAHHHRRQDPDRRVHRPRPVHVHLRRRRRGCRTSGWAKWRWPWLHRVGGFDARAGRVHRDRRPGCCAWLAARFVRTGLHPVFAVGLVLLAAAAAAHPLPRPPAPVHHVRHGGGDARGVSSSRAGAIGLARLAWLIPLFWVWTNIHGGMLGGLTTFGLAGIGWVVCSGEPRASTRGRATEPGGCTPPVHVGSASVVVADRRAASPRSPPPTAPTCRGRGCSS